MLPEPPQNGEYLVAAYVITPLILGGYWLALWKTARRLLGGERVSGENTA